MSNTTKQPESEPTLAATEPVASDARAIYVPDYGVTVDARDDEEAVKLAKKLVSKKEDK